ncbi:hypothetical protein HPP92_017479 [Vanilla planifolia]|uniref:Uncharacterized protein n=1 Tax=Vanilla planifolia TaxID=51239 RepID=A0A835QE50_VANPL|nr:hypothetical protein HPP92_017479 [Vanilla planifolia]
MTNIRVEQGNKREGVQLVYTAGAVRVNSYPSSTCFRWQDRPACCLRLTARSGDNEERGYIGESYASTIVELNKVLFPAVDSNKAYQVV